MNNLCAGKTHIGSVWVAVSPAPASHLVCKPLEASGGAGGHTVGQGGGAGHGHAGGEGVGAGGLVLGHEACHTQTREVVDLLPADCTNTRWG